jgi:hypothetical protein
LGRSWTPWKGKEISFPMELVYVQIRLESIGIVETIGYPNLSWWCTVVFGLWAVYCV